MLSGFKDFLMRGNVVDLAVAVVVGSAFTAIVTSFTDKIINPLIAALGGSPEFGFGFHVRPGNEATFVDIGAVISAAINFLIIAAVVYFLLILPMNKLAELNAQRKGLDTQEAAATETQLLAEIRDLLQSQQEEGTGARSADEGDVPAAVDAVAADTATSEEESVDPSVALDANPTGRHAQR